MKKNSTILGILLIISVVLEITNTSSNIYSPLFQSSSYAATGDSRSLYISLQYVGVALNFLMMLFGLSLIFLKTRKIYIALTIFLAVLAIALLGYNIYQPINNLLSSDPKMAGILAPFLVNQILIKATLFFFIIIFSIKTLSEFNLETEIPDKKLV
jgi:putative Mn2+ efflux pump MntP